MDKNRMLGAIAGAGYSQVRLAQEMGLSKNTLNSKINGKGYFNTNEIEKICTILHIDDNAEKALIFLERTSQNRDELNQAAHVICAKKDKEDV